MKALGRGSVGASVSVGRRQADGQQSLDANKSRQFLQALHNAAKDEEPNIHDKNEHLANGDEDSCSNKRLPLTESTFGNSLFAPLAPEWHGQFKLMDSRELHGQGAKNTTAGIEGVTTTSLVIHGNTSVNGGEQGDESSVRVPVAHSQTQEILTAFDNMGIAQGLSEVQRRHLAGVFEQLANKIDLHHLHKVLADFKHQQAQNAAKNFAEFINQLTLILQTQTQTQTQTEGMVVSNNPSQTGQILSPLSPTSASQIIPSQISAPNAAEGTLFVADKVATGNDAIAKLVVRQDVVGKDVVGQEVIRQEVIALEVVTSEKQDGLKPDALVLHSLAQTPDGELSNRDVVLEGMPQDVLAQEDTRSDSLANVADDNSSAIDVSLADVSAPDLSPLQSGASSNLSGQVNASPVHNSVNHNSANSNDSHKKENSVQILGGQRTAAISDRGAVSEPEQAIDSPDFLHRMESFRHDGVQLGEQLPADLPEASGEISADALAGIGDDGETSQVGRVAELGQEEIETGAELLDKATGEKNSEDRIVDDKADDALMAVDAVASFVAEPVQMTAPSVEIAPSAIVSPDEFTRLLDKLLDGPQNQAKSWTFTLTDASLPIVEITLARTSAERWTVGMLAKNATDKVLERYTKLLHDKLDKHHCYIDAIEIV